MAKVLAYALVAFGLAYASLWWSYEQFYGHFDISPQDVGASHGGSIVDLSSAALQLGIWLVILLATMAVVPTAAVFLLVLGWTRPRGDAAQPWLLFAGSVLVAGSFALYEHFVERWPGPILLLCGFALAVAVACFRRIGSTGAADKKDDGAPSASGAVAGLERAAGVPVRVVLGVFLAVAVIGIALLDLPSDADEAGACASNLSKHQAVGELNAPIPVPGLHLPILDVHAQPAHLTWLTTNPPRGIPPDVVYLGQSNGTVLVYFHKATGAKTIPRTSRIPAGDVIVSIKDGAKSCPGVHS